MKNRTLLRAAALLLPISGVLISTSCKKEEAAKPAPPAAAPAAAAASDQKFTYQNVTLTLPNTWKPRALDNNAGAEAIGPRDGDWEPNLFLKINNNPENESGGEILVNHISQLAAEKQSFSQPNKQFPLKLADGTEYARLSFKCKSNSIGEVAPIDLSEWYVVIPLPDKRWLEIHAIAAEDTWDREQPVFEKIINSVTTKK